jgi:hypothetical protein
MIEPAARDYAGFLVEVKARIRRGQYQALRAANAELVGLYWDIGEAIHRKQESLGWGGPLSRLSRQAKTATAGYRNLPGEEPRHSRAV